MYRYLCAAAVAAGALFTSSASAAVMIVSYAGEITSTSANEGFPQYLPADLVGTPIVLRFYVDTERGLHTVDANSDILSGGTSLPGSPDRPFLNIDLVFGNFMSYSPGGASLNLSELHFDTSLIRHFAALYNGGQHTVIESNFTVDTMPPDHATPFSSTGSGSGAYDFTGSTFMGPHHLAGTFSLTSVTSVFEVPNGGGGVPEPAAWAMMVLGFGAAGGLLRRRRAPAPA